MSEEVLLEKIENLTKKVEDGFAGVWKRQDTTNGNIDNNKSRIDNLEKEDIRIVGKFKIWRGYWIITGILVSVILGLLGKYVY